jgi:hypothetical protein
MVWNNAILETTTWAVEVLEEEVDCEKPLGQSTFSMVPFLAGDDSRDQIEGEDAFQALLVSIDSEGDPLVHQGNLLHAFASLEFLCTKLFKGVDHRGVMRPGLAVLGEGFIKSSWCVFPLHGVGFYS